MKNIDYSQAEVPASYLCANCGVTGIKLWREYQNMHPQLLCAICAGSDQGEDVSNIDEQGTRSSDLGGRTDQIGIYVPAIPDEEGTGYWGYTSVPPEGVDWWRSLPTKKDV